MNITRQEIEDFLYQECELLDKWQLNEWLELFTDTGCYYIPSTEKPEKDHIETLYIIADDHARLTQRVKRLLKKEAHIEYPHSKTNHNVTNVRMKGTEDGIIHVICNFTTYRTKREVLDIYLGHIQYKLVMQDGKLRIQEKKIILDLDALRPQGKVSIIL